MWLWALAQMCKLGIEPDKRVKTRFDRSMQYAVGKALAAGPRNFPNPSWLRPEVGS